MSIARIIVVAAVLMVAAGCAGTATAEKPESPDSIAASTVKVLYHLRYDEGEAPGGRHTGGWYYQAGSDGPGKALEEKRPLEQVGYLVAADRVLTEDLMIEDRFIESIEVVAMGRTYPAVIDSLALGNRGVFLKLAGIAENAAPLTFAAKGKKPWKVVAARLEADEVVYTRTPMGEVRVAEQGALREYERPGSVAPVVDADGAVAGFAMSRGRMEEGAWKGSPLDWPSIGRDEFGVKMEGIEKAAGAGILHVVINFRARASRRYDMYYSRGESLSETHAAGLLVDGATVLVLTGLARRDVARIESVTARCGQASAPLEIVGALKDYGVLVAKLDGELEGAQPLGLWDGSPGGSLEALFAADRLSFENFARDERFLRSRFLDIETGYKGLGWPRVSAGADVFVFTLDAELAAAPLALRGDFLMSTNDWQRYNAGEESVSMPSARLVDLLAGLDDAMDGSYRPLGEEESKRMAWLGVEMQALDVNLARANDATLATKGGEIGALVLHVYEGSPAAEADMASGDILLRVLVDGQKQPANVGVSERGGPQFPWGQLDEIPDIYFEQLPRPWPSRENDVTKFLTDVGVGRTVTVVLLRDGEEHSFETPVEMAPRDFSSAEKFEHEDLGATVKNLTYEVRRYFQMDLAAPGVVIAEIKPGSKASVAGLKPCEIITAVNASPVADVDEFAGAVAEGGEVTFIVQRMFESRMVQVYLEPAEEAGEGEAAMEGETPQEVEVDEGAAGDAAGQ